MPQKSSHVSKTIDGIAREHWNVLFLKILLHAYDFITPRGSFDADFDQVVGSVDKFNANLLLNQLFSQYMIHMNIYSIY